MYTTRVAVLCASDSLLHRVCHTCGVGRLPRGSTAGGTQGSLKATSNAAFIIDNVLVPEVARAHPEITAPPLPYHAQTALSAPEQRQPQPSSASDGVASSVGSAASDTPPPHPTAPTTPSDVVTQGDGTDAATVAVPAAASHASEPAAEGAGGDDGGRAGGDGARGVPDSATPVPRPREVVVRDNAVAAAEDRALRLYHRAAVLQDAFALLRIGDYYYYGRAGLPPSAEKAASYYKLSTENGKHPQVRIVARCYVQCSGV